MNEEAENQLKKEFMEVDVIKDYARRIVKFGSKEKSDLLLQLLLTIQIAYVTKLDWERKLTNLEDQFEKIFGRTYIRNLMRRLVDKKIIETKPLSFSNGRLVVCANKDYFDIFLNEISLLKDIEKVKEIPERVVSEIGMEEHKECEELAGDKKV